MDKRIMIMAGGTGGHVFPALAVALLLIQQGWQVSWMGTRLGLESRVVPENNIDLDWLSVTGLRGKGRLALLKAPLMMMLALHQALQILRIRKPDVVLGMGGFVAGPGGLMAKILGIPLVIHEQNRIPGTTNRLLSRIANVVLEAFPHSFTEKAHAISTGNPLRKELTSLLVTRVWQAGRDIHLLVIGGSQGARILNELVPSAAALMDGIVIRHQSGNAMVEQVQQQYTRLDIKAEVSAFIEDMAAAYKWADCIICRAGAMTISETAAAGLPAILIPFPHAIDDHQSANAQFLVDAEAGILIPQEQLNAELLAEQLKHVIENLQTMSVAAGKCARLNATNVVAEICSNEAGHENA